MEKERLIKITRSNKYSPPEGPRPPQEHLLQVYIGKARVLIPETPEYEEYDGLETGGLSTCVGIALCIPRGEESIFGIGHSIPSQHISRLVEQFEKQLREAGTDLRERRGFVELIPGQMTYYKEKSYLRNRITRAGEYLRERYPNLQPFPISLVSYSVLSGHLSSRVKLLKGGRLIISGEGKAY